MDIPYILFILTFLIFPIIAFVISINIRVDNFFKYFKIVGIIFLIHNIFFLFGFSLRGNYIDYFIFSFEYFFFSFVVFSIFKSKKIYFKIIGILGSIVIAFCFIIGFVGIFIFLFISQDFEIDEIFKFENNGKQYETRSHGFGGATLSNTRYTFETYRVFKYFPLEHKLDKTDFFDDRTNLNIGDQGLKISIIENKNNRKIIFQSSNGNIFSKPLKN